ncbi:hypothetical protein GCM10022225_61120 [Plantactinospora mayteni]|uniref:CHAT domain-containing protein n=1 Tax=Plantactinospora mayteni TaxID=566021 RepID=A0ABQ4EZQ2_9ACTN|nr:CHAT domain-containing protein [Plantactinospora mayteni]GIH00146.1 hypothetical protein Pma05_67180 [Plantactinospora mayteni]
MPDGAAAQPSVRVHTRNAHGVLRLDLTAPATGARLAVRLVPADQLRRHCAELGNGLARIVERQRRAAPPSVRTAGEALAGLAALGRTFLFDVLADAAEDSGRLVGFLRAACPGWRTRPVPAPLLYVVAEPGHFFPWELLPLFDPAPPSLVRDQSELERVALAFTGFAATVERQDPDRTPPHPDLSGWPGRLAVRLVYHGGLPGARQELGFFRGRGRHIRLEGPYPADLDDWAAPTLAAQLCDPRLGVDGKRGVPADQVLHFACDCAARDEDPEAHGYLLADDRERELLVRLAELKSELVLHWTNGTSGGTPEKPLVFLNACGTAVMDPASAVSLLQPFQHNRNRGVIATAANVPDRVAAEVSRWFYTGLLTGTTVGQALHEAKWRLLEDRGSLLGLLYSLHGPADMRIRPLPAPVRSPSGGAG